MKSKNMPSVLAAQYVDRTLPYEGTMARELAANRVRRAFQAGYRAARKRFKRAPSNGS